MDHSYSRLLEELLQFVHDEQVESNRKLMELWSRPIGEKLEMGMSQAFSRLERAEDRSSLWAYLGEGDSLFREGDLVALHSGSPMESLLARGLALEAEDDGRWLLRGHRVPTVFDAYAGGVCFGDPDAMDLTPYYERALEEISISQIGREIVLPLLEGQSEIVFDERDLAAAESIALAEGFNARQAEAIGLALGAEQIACIQGPPGTGKTRVLALIARLMVQRGERILMTSHTHTSINNALNKIHAQGVPVAKVGRDDQRRGLDDPIACYPSMAAWENRPTDGYVVGATPFATCSARLENHEFDTIIFDEASQITVPLALMAMRKGRKFIFIGDQKQLPPVMVSRSVLCKDALSVFARLTSRHADHTVMLTETYRMNRWLTQWPSRAYYDGRLVSVGENRDRMLSLSRPPDSLASILDPSACGVFIPTLDRAARTLNFPDAELVVEICAAAADAGLAFGDIGVVTPYRAQGRAVRTLLAQRFGREVAQAVVADTVERMQGQEREMVILSLATGDPLFLGAVAPFFFQPERLNVSVTRPMTKLIVIGPALESAPDVEDETVRSWIRQYIELLRHLKRVER